MNSNVRRIIILCLLCLTVVSCADVGRIGEDTGTLAQLITLAHLALSVTSLDLDTVLTHVEPLEQQYGVSIVAPTRAFITSGRDLYTAVEALVTAMRDARARGVDTAPIVTELEDLGYGENRQGD